MDENRRRQIASEAAAWLASGVQRPLPAAERRRLDRWLAADPAHRDAFDTAERTWGRLAVLQDQPGPLLDDMRAMRRGGRAGAGRDRAGWRMAVACTVCLALAVALSAFWFGNPVLLATADYRTAPGELRRVALPDGSLLELGPASAVALHFDETERRVEQLEGLAYIHAVPREAAGGRPFVVQAANGRATALGTSFAVDRSDRHVTVTVVEHAVEVAATGAGGAPARLRLVPGQAASYDRAGRISPAERVDAAGATAWRKGLLVFDRQPLAAVVEVLNRYGRGRIVIADEALAARRVSGVFRAADAEDALATIAQELQIRAVGLPPLVTLLF